jgi:hypothetical protein
LDGNAWREVEAVLCHTEITNGCTALLRSNTPSIV